MTRLLTHLYLAGRAFAATVLAACVLAGTPVRAGETVALGGASLTFPGHTEPAIRAALESGVDGLFLRVASTGEGTLVAVPDHRLIAVSDAAVRFPYKDMMRKVDGETVEDIFVEDLTDAEFRILRARQPDISRDLSHNGQYPFLTVAQVLDLWRPYAAQTALMLELMHSTHYDSMGLSLEEPLAKLLAEHGLGGSDVPLMIAAREVGPLLLVRSLAGVRVIQLMGQPWEQPYDQAASLRSVTYRDMLVPQGLRTVGQYAWGIVLTPPMTSALSAAAQAVADQGLAVYLRGPVPAGSVPEGARGILAQWASAPARSGPNAGELP